MTGGVRRLVTDYSSCKNYNTVLNSCSHGDNICYSCSQGEEIYYSYTVEPLFKDPRSKWQCINYLTTRDILKKKFLLY